jgi:hypothetical protein
MKMVNYTVRVAKHGPDWRWEVEANDRTIVAHGFAEREIKARANGTQILIEFELGQRSAQCLKSRTTSDDEG